MNSLTIYVAGPLFSFAEREFNRCLVSALRARLSNVTFIMPQMYAKKITQQRNFAREMFRYCIESIDQADALLCVLDGPDADSGTCIEMGYAYARKKTIIGVRTDFRKSEDKGVNLMVSNVCQKMIWLRHTDATLSELLDELTLAFQQVCNP